MYNIILGIDRLANIGQFKGEKTGKSLSRETNFKLDKNSSFLLFIKLLLILLSGFSTLSKWSNIEVLNSQSTSQRINIDRYIYIYTLAFRLYISSEYFN